MARLPDDYCDQITIGDAKVLADRIPDGSVDLVFTDPVYERIADYVWLAETARRVLKPDGHLLCWQAVKYMAATLAAVCPEPPILYYRWTLGMTRSNVVQASYNAWLYSHWTPCFWFSPDPNSRPIERFRDSVDDPFVVNPNLRHKWAKPVKTTKAWLAPFTRPGAVVFDPFCGGGTIPYVSKLLGRTFIAFEIDPEIAQIAREWVDQAQPMTPELLPIQDNFFAVEA